MQLQCFCAGFPWILFGSGCPCFILVAPATPSSSKPVHSTDLVDASESCWGGGKKMPSRRVERDWWVRKRRVTYVVFSRVKCALASF